MQVHIERCDVTSEDLRAELVGRARVVPPAAAFVVCSVWYWTGHVLVPIRSSFQHPSLCGSGPDCFSVCFNFSFKKIDWFSMDYCRNTCWILCEPAASHSGWQTIQRDVRRRSPFASRVLLFPASFPAQQLTPPPSRPHSAGDEGTRFAALLFTSRWPRLSHLLPNGRK